MKSNVFKKIVLAACFGASTSSAFGGSEEGIPKAFANLLYGAQLSPAVFNFDALRAELEKAGYVFDGPRVDDESKAWKASHTAYAKDPDQEYFTRKQFGFYQHCNKDWTAPDIQSFKFSAADENKSRARSGLKPVLALVVEVDKAGGVVSLESREDGREYGVMQPARAAAREAFQNWGEWCHQGWCFANVDEKSKVQRQQGETNLWKWQGLGETPHALLDEVGKKDAWNFRFSTLLARPEYVAKSIGEAVDSGADACSALNTEIEKQAKGEPGWARQRAVYEKKRAAEAAEERKNTTEKQRQLALFRAGLKVESETNCGPVIEARGNLLKIYSVVRDYGNEHWIKRNELYPTGYDCLFSNGRYIGTRQP